MRRDAIWRSEAEAGLAKSDEDIRAAALLLAGSDPLLAPALFHCQQAVEKALKGFLLWQGDIFRKTHDLTEIANQALGFDRTLEPFLSEAASLSPFAYKFRYPGQGPTPDLTTAQRSLSIARSVYAAVLERLQRDWSSPDDMSRS